MLDTELFKIIIFCLKLMSADAQQVEMDIIQNYRPVASLSYEVKSGVVRASSKKGSEDFMKVKTIDNGLYKVEIKNESSFEVDLAAWFMKLDWENLTTKEQIIRKDGHIWLSIFPGKDNVYVIFKEMGRIFVLPKKYFKQK